MEPVSGMPTMAPLQPAVVGPEYCMPYGMVLSVKTGRIGKFVVKDVNGSVIMKAKGRLFSLSDRHVLVDAYDNLIISMQRKLFSLHSKWQAFRGDGCDLLFSVQRSSLLPFNQSLDVFLAANTSKNYCDFKIRRSFFGRSSTIYHGNSDNIVAKMDRRLTLLEPNSFRVTVYPNVDYAFVVALIVIFTEINESGSN